MQHEVQADLTESEERFLDQHPEPFFLCAGALVPYKRIDVAVEAFNQLGVPLWVVGGGPELEALRANANINIRFLGHVSEAFLWECYRRCRALIFPGVEDFGIVPIECLASGRPVIGIQAGGIAETVDGYLLEGADARVDLSLYSGVFVPRSDFGSPAALRKAVEFFCQHEREVIPDIARARARSFSYSQFFQNWRRFCEQINIYPGRTPQGVSDTPAKPNANERDLTSC
jgi:glycosyltransferase involved in cell wall biosynthesis